MSLFRRQQPTPAPVPRNWTVKILDNGDGTFHWDLYNADPRYAFAMASGHNKSRAEAIRLAREAKGKYLDAVARRAAIETVTL